MAAYGSGHFGRWITDEAGLPAYEYTCDHLHDPVAEYATRRGPSRDHYHLLGNARAAALAHNEGYIEFYRPDTGGAWLNRYAPAHGAYAGGFGFLRQGGEIRSTLYRHRRDCLYRRMWGVGYCRKTVTWGSLAVDQVTFMPFGDDPVLINLTTLTNRGLRPARLTYVEYWDVLVTPLLYGQSEGRRIAAGLAVRRSSRYDAARRLLIASPVGTFPGAGTAPSDHDPDPPTVFLAAIDGAPIAGFETSRTVFFGEGGLDAPAALALPYLAGNTFPEGTRGDGLVLALQREVTVPPHGQVALAHLYGYSSPDAGRADATGSATPAGLVERYASHPARAWLEESTDNWREHLIRFQAASDDWLTREAAWSSYYGQALARFDAYTGEFFLDQGGCYTFDWGTSQTPRDFCQHALALLPNNPAQVRGTIRHLTRLSLSDGSLAHAHLGYGRRQAWREPEGDLGLWLLWLIADYVLFYRDRAFADQEMPLYPRAAGRRTSIRAHVRRLLDHLPQTVGRGAHGLVLLRGGDGNDCLAAGLGPMAQRALRRHGESVLTSGLAGVALGRVAELCRWLGEKLWAQEVEQWVADNRTALAAAWNGRWFDRVLTPTDEPVGRSQLFLDGQPWAVLAGAADPEERAALWQAIHRLHERSPIGPPTLDPPHRSGPLPAGSGMNGGVSFAVNGALVWAMAEDDPEAAWELLKKSTLARHAAAFPDQWAGIWSGPDCVNSLAAEHPGEPWRRRRPLLGGGGWSHQDLPIANGHSHNQLLFALARLCGLEADALGYRLRPRLPCRRFTFQAARLGLCWDGEAGRIAGYLIPQGNDAVSIRVQSPDPLPGRVRVTVDGRPAAAQLSDDRHQVSFRAFLRGGLRTEWELVCE